MVLRKRRSVKPVAVCLAPSATRLRHQSLLYFVVVAPQSDDDRLLRVAHWRSGVPPMDFNRGGWWIVDDTGLSKRD